MADNVNNKTVEEQIADSEIIEKLRKQGGEEAVEFGKFFINLDKEEKDLALIAMGLQIHLCFDKIMTQAFLCALLNTKKSCPEEYDILKRCIMMGFFKKAEEIVKKKKQ